LGHLDPEALVKRLGSPGSSKVSRHDGGTLGVGIPEYQVHLIDSMNGVPDLGDIQLIDLEKVFFIDNA
jgi:hypothetical protein